MRTLTRQNLNVF